MAENIPPNPSTSAQTTAITPSTITAAAAAAAAATTATAATSSTSSSSATDQPGRPYYESLRTTLRATLEKKRRLDEQMAQMEDQIFKLEGGYLEDTALSGNIVRGFDGWVKGVSVGGGGGGAGGGRGGAAAAAAAEERRRGRVREEDRVFSRSSVSWMRAQDGPDSNSSSHAPTPTSSFAPPLGGERSVAGTPVASAAGRVANKKKRSTDRGEEEEEGKGNKRGKISYAREG